MKRHFALPAVIVISAHAFLLFGFTRKPGLPPPKPEPKPDRGVIEATPVAPEEIDPPEEIATVGEASGGKSSPPPPISPEIFPTNLTPGGILVPIDRTPVSVITGLVGNVIPAGFWRGGEGPYDKNGYGDGVHSVLNLDFEPRARVRPAPAYPFSLKANGVSGEVLVEFVVDESGRVLNPRVVRSTHTAFEGPTLSAVARWRFEPGTRRSKPVRFKMVVPVKFSLND